MGIYKEEAKQLAANRMKKIAANGDKESAHVQADDLLCDLLDAAGFEEVTAIFRKMDKWYS